MNEASTIDQAAGPDSRTIPLAAGPGGLATAAIVSLGSRVMAISHMDESRIRDRNTVPRSQMIRPDPVIEFAQVFECS